jgi:rhodanese-related sulfurtransferase
MWNSLFKRTFEKISFEDVQFAIENNANFILINTLPENEQTCLIKNTILSITEESIINELIQQYNYRSPKIIVYGKNYIDETAEKKCNQLLKLGFSNVYFYMGGMFEWLHLQDIYGKDEFPTTKIVLDILKYKPSKHFGGGLLRNG